MVNIFLIELITKQIIETHHRLAFALTNSKKGSNDNFDEDIKDEDIKDEDIIVAKVGNAIGVLSQQAAIKHEAVLQTQKKIIDKLNQEYNQVEIERLANVLCMLQKNRLKIAKYNLKLLRLRNKKKRHKAFMLACEQLILAAEKQAKLLALIAMQNRAEQYSKPNIMVNNFVQALDKHQYNIAAHIDVMLQLQKGIMACEHLSAAQKIEVVDLIEADIEISAKCHQVIEQVKNGAKKTDAALRDLISSLVKNDGEIDVSAMDDAAIVKKITELHANIKMMQREAMQLYGNESADDQRSIFHAVSDSEILDAKIDKACAQIHELSLNIQELGRQMLNKDSKYDALYAQMKAEIHAKAWLVLHLDQFKNEKDKLNAEILQHCHTLAANTTSPLAPGNQAKIEAEPKQSTEQDWQEKHDQQMLDLKAYKKGIEKNHGILALNINSDLDSAEDLYNQTLLAISDIIEQAEGGVFTEESYNKVEGLIKAYKEDVANLTNNQLMQVGEPQAMTIGFVKYRENTQPTETHPTIKSPPTPEQNKSKIESRPAPT